LLAETFKSNYSCKYGCEKELREYIFTDNERKLLLEYLEKGTKGCGWYTLENRIWNNWSALERDWGLMIDYMKAKARSLGWAGEKNKE